MKKTTYKAIDITIFCIIACVLEAINIIAFQNFRLEHYTLSIVLPISLIVMMRWREWAVLPAVLSGISYCIFCRGTPSQYLIYGLGNAFILLNLLWLKAVSRKQILNKLWMSMLFVVTGFIAINLGRSLVSFIFEQSIFNIISFFSTDVFNGVIALIIVAIARKQNGLFECQDDYFVRIAKESKAKNEEGIYG